MRVATWNVNGLRARLDFLLLWLAERRPDAVALQELKLTDAQLPADAFPAAGYRALVHGQKSWNGVAVLVRDGLEAEVVQCGLPGQEEAGARFLAVDVAGTAVTSLYCPNGKSVAHPDFPKKLAWLDGLVAHWKECGDPARPAVLGGDFNVCPGPLDSWNEEGLRGHIFHTDEERGRLAALRDAGLVDLFREAHPEQRAFSWWDYRAGAFHRNHGLRIDLLLATPPVDARRRAVEIDRDWRKKHGGLTPSDHAPVWVDLAD